MTAAEIADRLHATKTAGGWAARCPAHDDRNASLSLTEGRDGRTLLRCHAGCEFSAIVAAMGLKPSDLFPPRASARGDAQRRIVARYPYTDADGRLLFEVVRFDPKDFRQRRPDPEHHGAWLWNMKAVDRVLFRLPDVLKAVAAGEQVYVTEGEKDALALVRLGLCATCNAGGAGKWQDSYTAALKGARIVILPDRDDPGRKHGELVARALRGNVASLRVIELPDRNGRKVKDAADWIGAGGTREELVDLVEAAPEWTATATVAPEPTARPGKPDFEDIRAQLWELAQAKLSATEFYRRAAAAVVEWLHGRGSFYYDATRPAFDGVMYFDNVRKLLLPVQSDALLAWLADCLAVNRSERVFQFVASAVETEGLSERSTAIHPAAFFAARPGACYISNGPGRMARLSAGRVELVDNGTDGILFPVDACLEPWALVEPRDPFESCALFRDMAAAAPHGPMLFRLWATALPADGKTKPPLCVTAPVGAGKTALVRGLFALLGLPETVNAVTKTGEGDFWTAVDAGGLVCFDNCDTRVDWLADALAAAATAGTFTKRRLYTDRDRVTLRARAAIALTSANPTFAADAGLADRLLVVRLNRRTGETAESALFDEVRAARDAGLSWIAHTLAGALADVAPVPSGLNARHPDFAALAVRIGRAMGREAEAVNAMRAAEADKHLFNLENDAVGAALLELVSAGPFEGTAGALLEALKVIDPAFEGRLSDKRLGKRLSKLWPHLENTLGARKERDSDTKNWRYSFRPAPVFPVFGDAFSEKSYARGNIESFAKTPFETPETPEPTLFDNAEEPEPEAVEFEL